MTTVNISLLGGLVKWVEEQDALPEEFRQWRQDRWVIPETDCGTTCCVCGKLAVDAGAVINHDDGTPTFDGLYPADYGAMVLGTDPLSAERLFYGDNTAADIRRIAEDIAGCRL